MVLAILARALACVQTIAPERDLANYVWQAKAFLALDIEQGLAEVFPPLHALLLACLAGLVERSPEGWWLVAQLSGILFGTATVFLVMSAARVHFGPAAVFLAGLLLAVSHVSAWVVADGLSEPLFTFLVAAWLYCCFRDRDALAAAAAGLAFVTRPEAGVLIVLTVLRLGTSKKGRSNTGRSSLRKSTAARVLLLSLGPGILYLFLRWYLQGRTEVLPVASFMAPTSIFAQQDLMAALSKYCHQALRFFFQGFEALGYLAFPCLLLSLPALLSRGSGAALPYRLPVLAALCAMAVVPLFKAEQRFWLAFTPILLPLAALPLARLYSARPRLCMGLVLICLLPQGLRLFWTRRARLGPELRLARHYRDTLPKTAAIASDLPRFLFFAGRPAVSPRSIEASELLEKARDPRTVLVASLAKRNKLEARALASLGYEKASLPPDLADLREQRGMQLFERRP